MITPRVNATPRPGLAGPARRLRTAARSVHLVAGVLLGAYIYGPVALAEPLRLVIQLVTVPVLTLTGLVLWQQARLRRLVRRTAGVAR